MTSNHPEDHTATSASDENQPLLNQCSESQPYTGEPTTTSPHTDTESQLILPKKKMLSPHLKLLIYSVSLLFLFLAVFITTNVMLIYPQSEQLINQSSEFQIESVVLDQVTTKGLDVRIQGSNVIDYDNIKDNYISNVLKVGAEMFNDVSINLQSVNLQTTIDDKLETIGKVEIPEFKVDIRNKAETNLDFVMSIQPDTLKIFKLLKYVFAHPEAVLQIYGDTKVKLKLGGVYLGNYAVKFSQSVAGKQYFNLNLDEVSVNNIQLNKGGVGPHTTYNLNFQLSLPNPILDNMISFNVPQLDWQVFVGDCDQKANIPLLPDNVIETGGFKLSSHEENLTVEITTSLDKLNDKLLMQCKQNEDDGSTTTTTPMMLLMDQVLNNKSIPLMIKNKGGSDSYPSIVNDLLSNFDLNLNYNPNFETSQLIHNVSIDNLGFEFENGDINTPIINGNINIFIKLPVTGLTDDDFKIPKIKGLPKLLHHNMEFAEIPLTEWHECQNEVVGEIDSDEILHEYYHVQFKIYREPVVIKDKQIFGQVINEILYHGKSKILIDCLLDLIVNIAIFDNRDVTIDKVHVKSESEITRGDLF
ncbi:hypothetical protein WICPIJ_009582 [Wickerhamomyces pijperi]|uniref:Uncharacterized protein n=1 Tax=Wickerhamomyces pijperi TaxID=599730 RepID=A0A9P8PLE4_WICPI|nr:hypothetical protein WICPIJ_009582 [Wickerhamomyces pijperi]